MISRSQMNRQLYADGTDNRGIMSQVRDLIQGIVPKSKYMLPLTEEQAFAMMPEGVKEAYNSMLQAGASPEEARRLISQQLAEMSIQQMKMQRQSQDIPEYYDRRLQILDPRTNARRDAKPSMPMRDMRMGGGIMNVARENYGFCR
jgi:hypothetical protein